MYNYRELCERVIKDYDIPVYYIDQDQFKEVVETVDISRKFQTAFDTAHNYLSLNGKTVDEFSKDIRQTTESIINYITHITNYKAFCEADIPETSFEKEILGKRYTKALDLYIQPNVGKSFISIDITHANESAMLYSGATSFTFKELVKMCVPDELGSKHLIDYIANSKHIRQVVYGNTCPKRQAQVERLMTEKLLRHLKSKGVTNDDLYGYTTDEIILNYTQNTYFITDGKLDFVEYVLDNLEFKVHVDLFTLSRIEPHAFYVKERPNLKPTFKNIPKKYMAQAVKHYFNKPITGNDLRFIMDSDAVRFEKPLW